MSVERRLRKSLEAYDQLIQRLFSLSRGHENQRGLTNVKKLAKALDHPEKNLKVIHIAGTNGKGSVAFKLAKSLEVDGTRVGLFTSPHLFDFQERIQINGQMISRDEVMEGLGRLFSIATQMQIQATFFELTTLLAFDFFRKQQVDVAVIEAGMGGRLDATNIVLPLLTIITSIDFDHVDILGPTLDEIAYEKAGIIKKGVPLVIGKRAERAPVIDTARVLGSKFVIADSNSDPEIENQYIAARALEALGGQFSINPLGLRETPKCRYEIIGNAVFDVAHNLIAFEKLFAKVRADFSGMNIHLFLGLSPDKDREAILDCVTKNASHIYIDPIPHPRLISSEALARDLRAKGFNNFEVGLNKRDKEAVLVVAGSFYIMSHFRQCDSHLQTSSLVR